MSDICRPLDIKGLSGAGADLSIYLREYIPANELNMDH